MGANAVSDIPEGFQVVSESDIPPGFQIEHHPGIDFGQAAQAAGKAVFSPSPNDIGQSGQDPMQRMGQAALGNVYGQGKEILQNKVPESVQQDLGQGVTSTLLPGVPQGMIPKLVNQAIGKQGVGMGIDTASGFATEGIEPVAKGLSKMASGISEGAEENAGRVMNQYLKPREAQFSFGKNPGKEIANQGITAWNKGDLKNKVSQKLDDLNSQLQDIVSQHDKKGTTIDLSGAFKTISDKIKKLSLLPETTASQQEDLKSFGRDLYGLTNGNPTQVNPKNALAIKRLVGELPSWAVRDPKLGTQSDMARSVYGAIDQAMDIAMPETKGLNDSTSSLIGAKNALKSGMAREQNKSFVGLFDRLGIPGLGAALGFSQGGTPEALIGGGLGLGATKLASSAAGRTTIAKALADTGKAASGASEVLGQIKGPQIINRIMELFKDPETSLQVIDAMPGKASETSQNLLNRNKMSEIKSGAYLPQGQSSGPIINAEGSSTINMPEVLESDKNRMAQKYGIPQYSPNKEFVIPQGRLDNKKSISELVKKILKRRNSNFGGN